MPLLWLRKIALPAMGSKPQMEAMQLAPKPMPVAAIPLGAEVAAVGEAVEAVALAEEAGISSSENLNPQRLWNYKTSILHYPMKLVAAM